MIQDVHPSLIQLHTVNGEASVYEKKWYKWAKSRYFEIFWTRAQLPLNWRKPENNRFLREKNIRAIIINHKGIRMVKDGEDWHGLQTTTLKTSLSYSCKSTRKVWKEQYWELVWWRTYSILLHQSHLDSHWPHHSASFQWCNFHPDIGIHAVNTALMDNSVHLSYRHNHYHHHSARRLGRIAQRRRKSVE